MAINAISSRLPANHKPRLCKRRSNLVPAGDTDVAEGVFVSTRSLLGADNGPSLKTDRCQHNSCHTVETSSTSPPSSWKSTGSLDYHKGAPLLVFSPGNATKIEDQAEALGNILAKSRRLPSTWYFSSNHVMVNKERTERMIAPLTRLSELDAIARAHAEAMAAQGRLFHSNPHQVQSEFHHEMRRLGENVARGCCIREIHAAMMKNRSDKNNILDRRYTNMGMATATGEDGMLYLCQVFRG